MEPIVFNQLSNILPSGTAHSQGQKFVFLANKDSQTNLTQFAYGSFAPGEGSGLHTHQTMEEFFFIVKGEGLCVCGAERYQLGKGAFLRIPAGVLHSLEASAVEGLEFVYFGVAI